MIKALFFDLDGTLLDGERRVPQDTLEALDRCASRGVRFYLATGRPPLLGRMMPWLSDALARFSGGFYYNGACFELHGKKRYAFADRDAVREAMRLVLEYPDLNMALQIENEVHAIRFALTPEEFHSWGVDDMLPLCDGDTQKVAKAMVFYSRPHVRRPVEPEIGARLFGICDGRAQAYHGDGGYLFQFMAKGVSKLAGVLAVCAEMGWAPDEVAAFGDDHNDLEMLRDLPYGVAMGNAAAKVKSAARLITKTNREGGIAHAINNLLPM